MGWQEKFCARGRTCSRDTASTLERSQVFTPFENRLGHVTRSGSNSAFHSGPKGVWRPEHLFTKVSMPLILTLQQMGRTPHVLRLARHESERELHSFPLRTRIFMFVGAASLLFGSVGYGQSDPPAANSDGLDFKQFGLLAIQDGGRRKPIDTFARETLIRITGRSTYTDQAGRKWQPNDFVLSALLGTRDWKNEPMVLISIGQLIEHLGRDKTQRRFTFAQLTSLPELNRLANEAHALRKAERPVDRLQQEVMSVTERLALFAHVMDGSAWLIVPASKSETDPWVVPPDFSRYYTESQFAPAREQLQALGTAYIQADD